MKPKWTRISSSFTTDEVKIIDELAKELGITRAKFVKNAVVTAIGYNKITNLMNNLDAKTNQNLRNLVKNIFDESFINMLEHVPKVFQNNSKGNFSHMEKQVREIDKEVDFF